MTPTLVAVALLTALTAALILRGPRRPPLPALTITISADTTRFLTPLNQTRINLEQLQSAWESSATTTAETTRLQRALDRYTQLTTDTTTATWADAQVRARQHRGASHQQAVEHVLVLLVAGHG